MRVSIPAFCLLVLSAGGSAPAFATEPCGVAWQARNAGPPGTSERSRALATWLGAWSEGDLDTVLVEPERIGEINGINGLDPAAFQDVVDGPARDVEQELEGRLVWLTDRVSSGRYVVEDPGAFKAAAVIVRAEGATDQLRVLVEAADLRCIPMAAGLYTAPIDRDFDRNQCSALHPGEVLRVSRISSDGRWVYVHAGHSVGWLERPTMTPPMTVSETRRYTGAPSRLVVLGDWEATERGRLLRLGTSLPLLGRRADGSFHVLVAGQAGLEDDFVPVDAAVRVGFVPLTRRALLTSVLGHVGDPYAWGGMGSGRDCSRLLRDTFATFGIQLGRHSGVQARAGVTTVDVSNLTEDAKRAAIRAAGRKGVVFLYMPGHIMLYLGYLDGSPQALSAISEYLKPCPKGDQVIRLDRVDVTTLELGRDTARTAFIERIKTLAIFGPLEVRP
ncbi:MAG: hypothetical protein ACI9MR_000216 [Myxococcota bacterium]|jgi:hypothetical protein